MRRTLPTVLGVAALSVGVLPALSPAPAGASSDGVLAAASFDADASGWYAQRGASLSLTDGAVRVTAGSDAPAVLDDSPASISSTVRGTRYRAQVTVRSSTPALALELRLKEYAGSTQHGTATSTVTAGDTWTTLTTDYEAATDGSSIGVNIVAPDPSAGQSFEVDAVHVALAPAAWRRVYRNDFATMTDVTAWNSSTEVNDSLRPSDSENDKLQKPTVKENTVLGPDGNASDGKVIAAWTRPNSYKTSAGVRVGWSNGRWAIKGQDQVPPFHIKTRLRMTPSMGAKSAVMWWPAGGGWPWEVDFAETFGGSSLTDFWGSRRNVAQRWHGDINGDGRAVEQLTHNDAVNATVFHVYDLFVTPNRMWIEIDGRKTFETTDTRYIPRGPGFFTVGKALTGRRDSHVRSEDGVVVDWVEIYKPAS